MSLLPLDKTCLAQVEERIPEAVRLAQSEAGALPLVRYAAALRAPDLPPPPQDGGDLADLAAAETARLLSPAAGRAVKRALEDDFCALTANHHGADFHPEFVQGTLIFALDRLYAPALPVFACGGVPRHNAAYPRGMLLGKGVPGSTLPRRFPVLADRCRRGMVSVQPPFTPEETRRAAARLEAGGLSPREAAVARRFLDEIFAAPEVLAQSCYRDQATVMNARLWPRLFGPGVHPPPLVCLDMQYLSGRLIAADLADTRSLLHGLVLTPDCLLTLYRELDGIRGCWRAAPPEGAKARPQTARGTFLFWALDEEGRAVPLAPHPSGRALMARERPDLDVSLTAPAVAQALAADRLMPGLYLYFAATALARGLCCCGGVYQIGYLERMREGTARTLRACGEHALADRLRAAAPWSTGFLPVRTLPDGREKAPAGGWAAGPVEMAAHGGLSGDDLRRLGDISMSDAFALALAYHYEDLVPARERPPDWLERLSAPGGLILA